MKTAANMNNKRSWTKQQDHFTRPWYKHPTIVTLTNSDFFDPGVGPWAEPSRSSWGARSLATFLFFWRPRFYIDFEHITEELELHIQSNAQLLRLMTHDICFEWVWDMPNPHRCQVNDRFPRWNVARWCVDYKPWLRPVIGSSVQSRKKQLEWFFLGFMMVHDNRTRRQVPKLGLQPYFFNVCMCCSFPWYTV